MTQDAQDLCAVSATVRSSVIVGWDLACGATAFTSTVHGTAICVLALAAPGAGSARMTVSPRRPLWTRRLLGRWWRQSGLVSLVVVVADGVALAVQVGRWVEVG
jgi:hypothetical protein